MNKKTFYRLDLSRKLFIILLPVLILPIFLISLLPFYISDKDGAIFLQSILADCSFLILILSLIGFMILTAGLVLLSTKINSSTKLEVDALGVNLDTSAGVGWASSLITPMRPFSIQWDDVGSIHLYKQPLNDIPILALTNKSERTHQIDLRFWSAQKDEKLGLIQIFKTLYSMQKKPLADLIKFNPVLLEIQKHASMPIIIGSKPIHSNIPGGKFNLFSNRSAVVMMTISALSVLVAAADIMLYGPAYLSAPPWPIIIVVGVLTALVGFVTPGLNKIPKLEHSVLPILLGLALSFLTLRAVLYVDLYLSSGYTVREFRLINSHELKSNDPSIPSLPAPIDNDFWDDQEIGSMWQLKVSRGSLGIWKYDPKPVLKKIQDYNTAKYKNADE